MKVGQRCITQTRRLVELDGVCNVRYTTDADFRDWDLDPLAKQMLMLSGT